MKQNIIKYLFRVLAIVLPVSALMVSCTDPSGIQVQKKAITITSAEVLFGPKGGTGTIGYESELAVTAYSEQPWCSVSVEKNQVIVKAEEYADLENRYSSIILQAGDESIRVVAQQNGIVMKAEVPEKYYLSDEATEISVTVDSNSDLKVRSSATWIRCTATEGKVSVTVRKNEEGHPRTGWFSFSSGNVTETVYLSQTSAQDLCGNYKLMGYSSSNALVYLPASISAGSSENELMINVTADGVSWNINASFNPEDHSISYTNGQYAGTWTALSYNFHVYLCMLSKKTNNFSWDTALAGTGTIEYNEDESRTVIDLLPLKYNNGVEDMELDSWVFAAFQNRDAETGRPKGTPSSYPAIFYTPYLQSY